MSDQEHFGKLDVFALPNQTTILFSLIAGVLFITITVGSLGTQPFMVLLAVGIFLLPWRAFLAWPEREFTKHQLRHPGNEFPNLAAAIQSGATAIKLARVPQLVVGQNAGINLHIVGSFRRWYIVMSESEACQLETDLKNELFAPGVHALLLHELYHFKSGDYWQMRYIKELLRTSALFMLWALAFLMGYGFLLLIAKPYIIGFDFSALANQLESLAPQTRDLYLALLPSPDEWAVVQQKAAEINLAFVITFITNATMPFIVVGGILWLLYWPKLLRTREFYADAGVAQTQARIDHLFRAILLGSRSSSSSTSSRTWVGNILYRLDMLLKQIRSALKPPTWIRKWFSKHPEFERRIDALQSPVRVYDSWLVTALSLGGLALILDMMLSTPLTLPYHGQWPMHFAVISISVLVTLSLIPSLVLGQSAYKQAFKIVGVIVALRFTWLMLTIGMLVFLLVFAPSLLADILTAAVVSTARYTRYLETPVISDLTAFVLKATWINTAQVFIVLAALSLLVLLNAWLLRRLLTWYGYQHSKRRLIHIVYWAILWNTVWFSLAVLTPVTVLLLRLESLFDLVTILLVFLGIAIATAGAAAFFLADSKYANRCPQCNERLVGHYFLGRRCGRCNELLHPWLITEYES